MPHIDELPDTPVGRQAAWFLRHTFTHGAELTVEEIAEHMRTRYGTPENSLERFRTDPTPLAIRKMEAESEVKISVWLADDSDARPVVVTFWVEEQSPHKIVDLWWVRDVGDSVVIREAREAEGPELRQLEVRSPLRIGDATIVYDRGDDFFAFARLMEETTNLVAEEHGEILALECAAMHTIEIAGQRYQAMLIHHLRIPQENQKRGLYSPLNGRCFQTYRERMEVPYAYVAIDNASAGRLHGPEIWNAKPMRGVLRCADLAGPSIGRAATKDDAPRVVEILNACHDGEATYLPYTADSLTERLERAPDVYTWGNVWMTDNAAVGVWPSELRIARTEGSVTTENVRAAVLDNGFLPGAEDEFESLLRAWCGWLADRGTTELAIYTSEGSRNNGIVTRLAAQIDMYDLRMDAPEPPDMPERGLYVDAVYF